VQCFEVGALKTIRKLTGGPLVQLVSAEGGPADLPGLTYAEMISAEGLKAISTYAQGVGPDWKLVVPVVNDGLGAPTDLVPHAHKVGLAVHPWTVRAENAFLPPKLRSSTDPAAHGQVDTLYRALFAAGVDGLFSDFPGLEARVRDQTSKRRSRRTARPQGGHRGRPAGSMSGGFPVQPPGRRP